MTNKALHIIDRVASPIVAWSMLALFVLFSILFQLRNSRLEELSGDPGSRPLATRFDYKYDEASSYLKSLKEEGRSFYKCTELALDLPFPLIYATLFSSAILLLTLTSPHRKWLRWLCLLPILTLVADYFETCSLVEILYQWPNQEIVDPSPLKNELSRLKSFTVTKTILFIASLLTIAMLYVSRPPKKARSERFIRCVGVLMIVVAALGGAVEKTVVDDPDAIYPGGIKAPLLSVELFPEKLKEILAVHGAPTGSQIQKSIKVDYSFIVAYWILFSILGYLLGRRTFRGALIAGALVILLAAGSAIFDFSENIGLTQLLEVEGNVTDDFSSIATSVRTDALYKWGMVFALIALLSGLFLNGYWPISIVGLFYLAASTVGLIGLCCPPLLEFAMKWLMGPAFLFTVLTFLLCPRTVVAGAMKCGGVVATRIDPIFGFETPLIFAHRGGAKEQPESTKRAFNHARNIAKAEVLEIDLQMTRDRDIVVWHGPGLTNVRINGKDPDEHGIQTIMDLPSDQLPKTRVMHPDGSDAGRDDADTQILLFTDFLNHYPGVPLNIELKTDSFKEKSDLDAIVDTLRQELEKGRRIVVVSQSSQLLAWFRSELRQCHTGLGVQEALRLFFRGMIPGISLPSLQRVALESIHLIAPVCFIERVKKAGAPVYVFLNVGIPMDANDGRPTEKELFSLLERGVDGVMTDRPAKVREIIEKWRMGP